MPRGSPNISATREEHQQPPADKTDEGGGAEGRRQGQGVAPEGARASPKEGQEGGAARRVGWRRERCGGKDHGVGGAELLYMGGYLHKSRQLQKRCCRVRVTVGAGIIAEVYT